MRVAELMHARGLSGTFYVPINSFSSRASLLPADVKNLARAGFEIGAHGINHENLVQLPQHEVFKVAKTSKSVLQNMLGCEIKMFCYPGGRHNDVTVHCLKQAGFVGARTTRMLATRTEFDPFEVPTSLQAFPHNHLVYLKNAARCLNLGRCFQYAVHLFRPSDWVALGKLLFRHVLQHGGIWHLYGHSWEVDQLSLWDDLTRILDYVSRRPGVRYMSNGDLILKTSDGRTNPSR
jgi:peptidoglycan/xylan/chitin deacetylase (PgdA/CDA1 family)